MRSGGSASWEETREGREDLRRGWRRQHPQQSEAPSGSRSSLGANQRAVQAKQASIVLGGSKTETIKDFLDGVAHDPDFFNVLLVDADEPVTGAAQQHLQKQSASIDWSKQDEDALQLMVQTMETWIVADPEGLARVYGKGFKTNSLPTAPGA